MYYSLNPLLKRIYELVGKRLKSLARKGHRSIKRQQILDETLDIMNKLKKEGLGFSDPHGVGPDIYSLVENALKSRLKERRSAKGKKRR